MSQYQYQTNIFTTKNSNNKTEFGNDPLQNHDTIAQELNTSGLYNYQYSSLLSNASNDDTKSVETSYSSDGSTSFDSQHKCSIAGKIVLHNDRNENDVLLGRGKGSNNWVGNKKFRKLVAKFQEEYFETSRREKPVLAKRIADLVKSQNPPGRFLQYNNTSGIWYEVDDDERVRKSSQALREGRLQRGRSRVKKTRPSKNEQYQGTCNKEQNRIESMGPFKKRIFKSNSLESDLSSPIEAAYALLAVGSQK